MDKYDEDLYDNPFFTTLQNQYPKLYESATGERWTICIPRYSALAKEQLTLSDIEDHIVRPSPDDSETYKTWSQKSLTIDNGEIKLQIGQNKESCVKVLFEETFYNNNDQSYKVVCVECLINREQSADDLGLREQAKDPLKSYEESMTLLFSHSGGKKTQDSLDKQFESFAGSYSRLASAKLSHIVEMANSQFTKAMQTALKDSYIRRNAQESKRDMENLKVAVELYMMHYLHKQMFQAIMTVLSTQDASVNKSIRSLTDIKLKDLGVRSEFSRSVKTAKKELLRLNLFSTPLGRLKCIKRVVSHLSSTTVKSNHGKKEESLMMTTDDFLPIMIYLIIMSEIPNWQANLKYMKHFSFSRAYNYDEYMFYLTTIEAAIEHICSGQLQKDAIRSYKVKATKSVDPHSELSRQMSAGSTVERFFHYVQCGDEAAVRLLLEKKNKEDNDITLQMCHPLCDCDKCSALQNQMPTDVNLVMAYTRDDRGYTALHIAALHGQAHLIDLLVHHGAIVNASDYLSLTPLHLACQKGYQNIILLLIHFGADCTMADGAGNTPLHLCVDGGHEDCVKALVFTDVKRTKINISAQNSRGDTPLHIAAKWGYEYIISILLENFARTDIKNRKKQLPSSLAQNANIQSLFSDFEMLPKIITSREKAESIPDYEIVKVVKARRPQDVKLEAPSSPPAVVTPEVVSLDEVDDKLIEKLFRAIEDGDTPMVCYYMKWDNSQDSVDVDVTVSPCHPLCQCQKCSGISVPSASGANDLHVNISNKTGYTPLMKAVQAQRLDLAELFIKRGAKVNTQNHRKISALHIACYFSLTEIALLLLKNGAKVNIKDGYGDTPLHLSCSKGCVIIIQYLLKFKAFLNSANSVGNTPLHNAVRYGWTNIVRLLLEVGANPIAQNKEGHRPVDLSKNWEIHQILITHMEKMKKRSHSYKDEPSPTEESTPDKVLEEPAVQDPVSEDTVSIKKLIPECEESYVESLRILGPSIKDFDPKKSLRKATTKDTSAPNLRPLRHSSSIQNFDFAILKHVESIDKSEPLHIYKLALGENHLGTNREILSDDDKECEDVFSDDLGDDKNSHDDIGNKDLSTSSCIQQVSSTMKSSSDSNVDQNDNNCDDDLHDVLKHKSQIEADTSNPSSDACLQVS